MTDRPPEATTDTSETLQAAIETLKGDFSRLANNLGSIEHSLETECNGLTLRLHYPVFRQRKPMVAELIGAVSLYVINFCLPRQQVNKLYALYGRLSADEFAKHLEVLRQEAYDLFKRAHRATNRSGEAGELILYLLTEWLLGAPQIIAKMSLKTSRDMAVHGADGVHVRVCPNTGRLFVYWGEAKLYKNIGSAITAAADSIAESLTDEKLRHEISLVKQYLDLSGMSESACDALHAMLDPFGPGYANRHDIVTCLIAFDFDAYGAVLGASEDAEELFRTRALAKLAETAPRIATALKGKSLAHQPVELFLLPVPSVDRMRDLFQDKIGWTDAPPPEGWQRRERLIVQELANHIWRNEAFHAAAALAHKTWLARELGQPLAEGLSQDDAVRLVQAAAVLACSSDPEHRRQAYQSATTVYELVGSETLPMEQALRVVLSRLGNFPALETRSDVRDAGEYLPLELLVEELGLADQRRVILREEPVLLTDFQHTLWNKLVNGANVAVGAPTSAGKTFVLQGHLAQVFEDASDRTVIYLVPTRALIAQVSRDLANMFRSTSSAPEIVTVPLDRGQFLPRRAILVMTQERVRLMLASHPDLVATIVIVDEAHSIADPGRGVLLQWVVDDLLTRKPDAQLLFASPGIRNLEVFGRAFGLDNIERIPSKEPTVAQNFLIVQVSSAKAGAFSVTSVEPGGGEQLVGEFELGRALASRKERLVHIPFVLGRGASIVYANGMAEAENLALQLAELRTEEGTSPQREAVAQLAAQSVHDSYVLGQCIRRGVGFHYSNMPTQVRQAVEDAFGNGTLDFLVCTSTLLQGVNLPARNVFMYKPEKGRGRPLEGTDFWNLAGRAGRLRREFQGNIFLIGYDDWKSWPLDDPRDSEIVTALEAGVTQNLEDLVATMRAPPPEGQTGDGNLQSLFVRLLDDHAHGTLQVTLDRLEGGGITSEATGQVKNALDDAVAVLTLPIEVVRQSPNLSPHRQQSLYEAIKIEAGGDRARARKLIPAHPREANAYDSYVGILGLCNTHLLSLKPTDRRHRYHALMALFWMRGDPLPQIIENALRKYPNKSSQKTIRDTLETIEKVIRFEIVRLMSCHCAVLVHVFEEADFPELVRSIPPIPLYLEVGAADRSMISFMGLGLSRVTAAILNEATTNKAMTIEEARAWLRLTPPEAHNLSPLLLEEIRRIVA